MPLINSLESKLGRFAIPHLIRLLATAQLLTYFLVYMKPGFASLISLSKTGVANGELWRLLTWALHPGGNQGLLIFFSTMVLYMIGDTLEVAWGAFRVNLYVGAGMLAVILQVWFFPVTPDLSGLSGLLEARDLDSYIATAIQPFQVLCLNSTFIFAFACIDPDEELNLFMVLPLKMKWVALLDAAWILFTVLKSPILFIPALFSVLNFVITFAPAGLSALKQNGIVAKRRARFDAARTAESAAFHKCHACGKTEQDDHTLDFRVTADGEEYCTVCRPRK